MEFRFEVAYASCPPDLQEAWLGAVRLIMQLLEECTGNERRDRDGAITALEAIEQAKLGECPAIRTAPASRDEESIALVSEIV